MKRLLAVILCLVFSSPAFADKQRASGRKRPPVKGSLTVDDNPNPKGTGKIAGGIVMASVLGTLGAIILMTSAFGDCGFGEEESECRENKRNTTYLGAGLLVGGIGGGTVSIVSGVKDRRRWKEWNREHVRGYAYAPETELQASARFARSFVSGAPKNRGHSWLLPLYVSEF